MSLTQMHLALSALEIALGVVTLLLLIRAHEFQAYWPLFFVSTWGMVPFTTLLYVRKLGPTQISAHHAYIAYFSSYWTSFAIDTVCCVILTYTIFSSAMRPLKGLQSLGYIVYYWAAAITVAIAFGIAIAPRADIVTLLSSLITELQRGAGIMVLSLVIFVCIAIRPMGLSIRSRVLGVSCGLAITAITNMLQSNYMAHSRNMYTTYSLVRIITTCTAELIWIYYFAVPEPQRKFILLPTTSPFHRWNQISELLGHDPGYVAIGGIPPEAFAAAEIEVFHRASAKMNALNEAASDSPSLPGRLE